MSACYIHKRVKSLYTHVTCDQGFFPVRKAAVEVKRKKKNFFLLFSAATFRTGKRKREEKLLSAEVSLFLEFLILIIIFPLTLHQLFSQFTASQLIARFFLHFPPVFSHHINVGKERDCS